MGQTTINSNYSFDLSRHQIAFFILVLACTCAGIIAHMLLGYSIGGDYSGHAYGTDDAFITYRYAENLINGYGIVFNPGERVEGYSNFLYVLLMVPGAFLGSNYIYLYSVGINTVFVLLALIAFYRIISLKNNTTYGVIGAGLLGLNPSIWANTASGLETSLVLLIFLSLWITVESQRNTANIIWLLAISTISILARVDGFIFPLIATLYLLIKKDKKTAAMLISHVIVLMAIYTLLRYSYYNDIISNTYYAKVDGSIPDRIIAGILYLVRNTTGNAIALYIVFAALIMVSPLVRRREVIISFPAVFLVTWTSYMLYIGGDFYYERFLLPLLAIGIYFFLSSLQYFSSKLVTNTLLLVCFSSGFIVFGNDLRFDYQRKSYDMWVSLGKFLEATPDDYLIAVDAAGKVPFYSKLRTLDMLGLNDKVIGKMDAANIRFAAGHNKFDATYTLSKKPHLLATFIHPDFNMLYDVDREKYEDNYSVKYLVNASLDDLTCNIIDVQGLPEETVSAIIEEGIFYYAVIARKDILNSLPGINNQCKNNPNRN